MPFAYRIGPAVLAAAGAALVVVGRGPGPSAQRWAAYLFAGVLLGALLLPISTALVGGSPRVALRALVHLPRRFRDTPKARMMVLHYLLVSIGEEMFYRMGLQEAALGGGTAAIIGVSAVFTAVHQIGKREIVVVNVLELMAFSCLVGYLYSITNSLVLVIAVHLIRDIGVVLMREVAE